MGASGTRGDLHSDISATNLGDSQKALADRAASFLGSKQASYSMVGSKSNGRGGGGCKLKSVLCCGISQQHGMPAQVRSQEEVSGCPW